MTQLIKTVSSAYLIPVAQELRGTTLNMWLNIANVTAIHDDGNFVTIHFLNSRIKKFSGESRRQVLEEIETLRKRLN